MVDKILPAERGPLVTILLNIELRQAIWFDVPMGLKSVTRFDVSLSGRYKG